MKTPTVSKHEQARKRKRQRRIARNTVWVVPKQPNATLHIGAAKEISLACGKHWGIRQTGESNRCVKCRVPRRKPWTQREIFSGYPPSRRDIKDRAKRPLDIYPKS